jgi:hypothetical protein
MGLRKENHDRAGRLKVDDIGKLGIHAEPHEHPTTLERKELLRGLLSPPWHMKMLVVAHS